MTNNETHYIKVRNSLTACKNLCFLVVALILISSTVANAAEVRKDYHDPNYSPHTVDEYSRAGTTISTKFRQTQNGFTGEANVTISCSNPYDGQWSVTDINGNCWDEYEFCYIVPTDDVDRITSTTLAGKEITSIQRQSSTDGATSEICYMVEENVADRGDVDISPYSKCSGSELDAPSHKQYCAFDNASPDGITGDTDDDMFRINPGASTYMEYKKMGSISNSRRLKWVESSASKAMMLPSGPPGDYGDYERFMDTRPGGLTVEDGCYPVSVGLCGAAEPPRQKPPVSGLCGSADGGRFENKSEIPSSGRCYIGTPTNITESGNTFSWACRGIPSSEPRDNCSARKVQKQLDQDETPPEQEEPPSEFCFFHVSGLLYNNYFDPSWYTKIGSDDNLSTLVGPGEYRTSAPFAQAHRYTFDGIAIGRDTRVTIYNGPNFSGGVILDQQGPAIINNRIWNGMGPDGNNWKTNRWPGDFHNQFPPSSRMFSSSNMHPWGAGTSVKVSCD